MSAYETWRNVYCNSDDQPPTKGKILIEEMIGAADMHRMCTYAYIVCQAKNYEPMLLSSVENYDNIDRIACKYFSKYHIIKKNKTSIFFKIAIFSRSILLYISILFGKKLINSQEKGYLIGDIIYDQYLAGQKKATVHYYDIRLIRIIFGVLHALRLMREIGGHTSPAAVLVSHMVGLGGAPIASYAEQAKIPIYSYKGGHYGSLLRAFRRKSYAYSANRTLLSPLLDIPDCDFDRLFDQASDNLFSGRNHADALLAYTKRVYRNRAEFAENFGVNASKKNIFVMLHAFSDYPHSHFNGMLFDDYYDWFMKTMEFASKDSSVNWIVKPHPSSHLYPVTDVNWTKIKTKYSAPHICFLEIDTNFNTESIIYVGDAVLTCIGSAGFEISALGGLPSITAGDNAYSKAGFATYPDSREDYFVAISELANIEPLSPAARKLAKAFFIYTYQITKIQMSAIPNISNSEASELESRGEFFKYVENLIESHRPEIARQLKKYIDMVSENDFRLLMSSSVYDSGSKNVVGEIQANQIRH